MPSLLDFFFGSDDPAPMTRAEKIQKALDNADQGIETDNPSIGNPQGDVQQMKKKRKMKSSRLQNRRTLGSAKRSTYT